MLGRSVILRIALTSAAAGAVIVPTAVSAQGNARARGHERYAAGSVTVPARPGAARYAHASSTTEPGTAIQDFASQVETLGETQYANSFAGAVLEPSGQLTIYANPDTDTALVAAVNQLNTGGFAVQYERATLSYNDLDAKTNALAAVQQQLSSDGVQLVQANPDPASDTVDVSVAAPSPPPSSQADYLSHVASLIKSHVGDGYTVDPTYGTPATAAASRNVDRSPFTGGSNITNNSPAPNPDPVFHGKHLNCTSGFTVKGNAPGRDFMLTAGHCGGPSTFTIGNRVGGTVLGRTSNLYIRDGKNDDFQTIRESSGRGYVFTGSSTSGTTAPVTGQVDPPVGASITMDGGKTGEVNDTKVFGNNATIFGLVNPYNGSVYTASHLVESESTNGRLICQGGDSGGPAIQRTSGSGVKAVGTIVAVYAFPGEPGGSACASEKIGTELSRSNTSLVLAR